ncbi:MAG: glycosyltransferase [Promethearchaeota archaeon]
MGFKILYIIDSFPPSGLQSGIRALEFSKRLLKLNIDPIILTKEIESNNMFTKGLVNEIPDNLKIIRTKFLVYRKIFFFLNHIIKFDKFFQWFPYAYLQGKRILKEYKNIKLILTSGPNFQCHIISYFLSKKYKKPLILEYRDPWSFNPYHNVGKRLFSIDKIVEYIFEKLILKRANYIIVISKPLKEHLIKFFPFTKNKKIIIIPNGLNLHNYNIKNNEKRKPLDKIVFTFTGTIYGKRSIIPLLLIISKLNKENFFHNFNLKINIFGLIYHLNLNALIKKLRIEQFIYYGGVIDRTEALKEIRKCYLPIHIGENIDYPTISFKVWDYLETGKKILYIGREDSYTGKFLRKYNLGFIIPINNLDKGIQKFKELILKIKSGNINVKGDEKTIQRFSWDERVNKLKNIILNKF